MAFSLHSSTRLPIYPSLAHAAQTRVFASKEKSVFPRKLKCGDGGEQNGGDSCWELVTVSKTTWPWPNSDEAVSVHRRDHFFSSSLNRRSCIFKKASVVEIFIFILCCLFFLTFDVCTYKKEFKGTKSLNANCLYLLRYCDMWGISNKKLCAQTEGRRSIKKI